jgi:protein involved in polysaccharide export with SLBB domain
MTERTWRYDVLEPPDPATSAALVAEYARALEFEARTRQAKRDALGATPEDAEAVRRRLKQEARREAMAELKQQIATIDPLARTDLPKATISRLPDKGMDTFFELVAEQKERRRHGD